MNKYIIPVCDYENSRTFNVVIVARSEQDCWERFMRKFDKYSDSEDIDDFLKDLDDQDIIVGEITDVDTL